MRFVLAALFLGSVGVLACSGSGGGAGSEGSGAGSTTGTGTTTQTGSSGTGSTGTTTSTGTSPCPGPQQCTTSGCSSPGTYCVWQTPCGDVTYCEPLPSACTGTPTCACVLAALAAEAPGQQELNCITEATGPRLVVEGGATECCP